MSQSPRLIDLTRLSSRLGRGVLTGVDRVELAYLHALQAQDRPFWGLIRSKLGFFLLDRTAAIALPDLAQNLPPRADLLSRLTCRDDALKARVETALRTCALARCAPFGLARMLRGHLPAGFHYLNTGHANLSDRCMAGLRAGGAAKIAVLLHDTIPLDHPEFTRPGISAVFGRKLAVVSRHADLVIHSANTTRSLTERHLARLGRLPQGITAPLGIDPPNPSPMAHPHPYFVTIGTIEPRKNHALLLDVWDKMHATRAAADIPHLLILGGRGWADAALLHRLDRLPYRNQTVFERPGLPDAQVAGLLAGSQGLLFPSHVEGYGLPPLEAASLGVRVILPQLPIYQETLSDYPVYVTDPDSYSWLETILGIYEQGSKKDGAERGQANRQWAKAAPNWDAHFNLVLNLI